MLRVLTLILSALLTGLSPAPLWAEQQEHGNILYDLPDGFMDNGEIKGGLRFLNQNAQARPHCSCSIMITKGVPGAADPGQVLLDNPRLLVSPREADPVLLFGPQKMKLGDRNVAMAGYRHGYEMIIAVAVQLVDRTEVFSLRGSAETDKQRERTLEGLELILLPMIKNASYRSESATLTPMPKANPGQLSGLWRAWNTHHTFGLHGTVRSVTEVTTYVFWPDGHFLSDHPPQRLDRFDMITAVAAGPKAWGTYDESADEVKLTFADGTTRSLPRQGSGFLCGTKTCERAEPLSDGARVTGALRSSFFSNFAPGIGDGAIAANSVITFDADGRWETSDAKIARAGSRVISEAGQATGTYKIENGILTRQFDNGMPDARDLIYFEGDRIVIGTGFLDGNLIQ